MGCVNANGAITDAARRIMTATLEPASLTHIANQTELPAYRIRSAMRELSEAGLVSQSEDKWQTTQTGRDALKHLVVAR